MKFTTAIKFDVQRIGPRMRALAGLVGVVALATGAAPWTVAPQADGSTFVHVSASTSGATKSAFRVVVDVGAAQDPEGREGLAFVTAHATLEGPANVQEPLAALLAKNGATLDVDVGMFSTRYTLHASDAALKTLVPEFVSRVTNPFFHTIDLDKLVRRLDRKAGKLPASTEAQLDQLLFPSVNRGRTPSGNERSRAGVTIENVQAFFAENYRSSAMTWIAATAIPMDETIALVNDAIALPPMLSSRKTQETSRPNLPSEVSLKGANRSATIAKVWPKNVSLADCRGVALAFEVAFAAKSNAGDTIAVDCRRRRGLPLMIFRASREEGADSELIKRMETTMKIVRGQPVLRRNARAYKKRRTTIGGKLKRDPKLAVEFIANAIAGDERTVEEILAEWGRTPTAATKVKKSKRSMLTSKKSAVIDVVPTMKRNRSRNR